MNKYKTTTNQLWALLIAAMFVFCAFAVCMGNDISQAEEDEGEEDSGDSGILSLIDPLDVYALFGFGQLILNTTVTELPDEEDSTIVPSEETLTITEENFESFRSFLILEDGSTLILNHSLKVDSIFIVGTATIRTIDDNGLCFENMYLSGIPFKPFQDDEINEENPLIEMKTSGIGAIFSSSLDIDIDFTDHSDPESDSLDSFRFQYDASINIRGGTLAFGVCSPNCSLYEYDDVYPDGEILINEHFTDEVVEENWLYLQNNGASEALHLSLGLELSELYTIMIEEFDGLSLFEVLELINERIQTTEGCGSYLSFDVFASFIQKECWRIETSETSYTFDSEDAELLERYEGDIIEHETDENTYFEKLQISADLQFAERTLSVEASIGEYYTVYEDFTNDVEFVPSEITGIRLGVEVTPDHMGISVHLDQLDIKDDLIIAGNPEMPVYYESSFSMSGLDLTVNGEYSSPLSPIVAILGLIQNGDAEAFVAELAESGFSADLDVGLRLKTLESLGYNGKGNTSDDVARKIYVEGLDATIAASVDTSAPEGYEPEEESGPISHFTSNLAISVDLNKFIIKNSEDLWFNEVDHLEIDGLSVDELHFDLEMVEHTAMSFEDRSTILGMILSIFDNGEDWPEYESIYYSLESEEDEPEIPGLDALFDILFGSDSGFGCSLTLTFAELNSFNSVAPTDDEDDLPSEFTMDMLKIEEFSLELVAAIGEVETEGSPVQLVLNIGAIIKDDTEEDRTLDEDWETGEDLVLEQRRTLNLEIRELHLEAEIDNSELVTSFVGILFSVIGDDGMTYPGFLGLGEEGSETMPYFSALFGILPVDAGIYAEFSVGNVVYHEFCADIYTKDEEEVSHDLEGDGFTLGYRGEGPALTASFALTTLGEENCTGINISANVKLAEGAVIYSDDRYEDVSDEFSHVSENETEYDALALAVSICLDFENMDDSVFDIVLTYDAIESHLASDNGFGTLYVTELKGAQRTIDPTADEDDVIAVAKITDIAYNVPELSLSEAYLDDFPRDDQYKAFEIVCNNAEYLDTVIEDEESAYDFISRSSTDIHINGEKVTHSPVDIIIGEVRYDAEEGYLFSSEVEYGHNVFVLLETPHTPDTIPGFPATCTEEGLTDEIYCTECLESLEGGETIPPMGHDYGELHPEVPVTCTVDGTIAYYQCSRCQLYFDENNEHVTNLVIPCGHKYGELVPAKAATCDTDGNIAYYQCSACETYFDQDKNKVRTVVIPATGVPGESSIVVENDKPIDGSTIGVLVDGLDAGAENNKAQMKVEDSSIEVEIEKDAIQQIIDKNASLEVASESGSVALDKDVLSSIVGKAGQEVLLNLDVVRGEDLRDHIPAEMFDKVKDSSIVSVNLYVGNEHVHVLNGVATFSIPYTLPAGQVFAVYYLNDQTGELELIEDAVYDAEHRIATFSTTHFSNFSIGEGAPAPEKGGNMMIYAVVAIIAIVAVAGVAFFGRGKLF